MAHFTNSDQTTVQLIQIKSDLQFDRQIKLKSFHQHISSTENQIVLSPIFVLLRKTAFKFSN